jgi:hypothetical protein
MEDMKKAEEEARRAKKNGDNPTVIPPVKRTDTPRAVLPEDIERLIEELKKVEEEARRAENSRSSSNPDTDLPREAEPGKRLQDVAEAHEKYIDRVTKSLEETDRRKGIDAETHRRRVDDLEVTLRQRQNDLDGLKKDLQNVERANAEWKRRHPDDAVPAGMDRNAKSLKAEIERAESEIAELTVAINTLKTEREDRIRAVAERVDEPGASSPQDVALLDDEILAAKQKLETLRAKVQNDPRNDDLVREYKAAGDRLQRLETARNAVTRNPANPSATPETGSPGNADTAHELRKLLNDKDVELATLKSRPDPDVKRIREVEASIAALRKALAALERQDAAANAKDALPEGWTTYTIREGDSWWKIAHTHFRDRRLSSEDILRANPGIDLVPGNVIKIPAGK